MKKQTYIAPQAKMLGMFTCQVLASSLNLKPGEDNEQTGEKGGYIEDESEVLSNKKQNPWGSNKIWKNAGE